MACALLIKPHDIGPVWLYFVLAGGLYRKRALQVLAFTVALGVPTVLCVTYFSPHWISELHYLLSVAGQRGGVNDPGPASTGDHGLAMMTNLQTALTVIWDNPRFYNPVTWLVAAPMLAIWLIKVARSQVSPLQTWLALASITPMLLVGMYHRQHDALLMLLAVPACAMLKSRAGSTGKLAVAFTITAFVFTGNILWTILFSLVDKLRVPFTPLSERILIAVISIPIPVVLLVMTVFYLRTFLRLPNKTAPLEMDGTAL